MIELGSLVRDVITSFTGIAIARTDWLYGCVRIMVQPTKLKKDGTVMDAREIDEAQLEILKPPGALKKGSVSQAPPSGPKPSPSRPTIQRR